MSKLGDFSITSINGIGMNAASGTMSYLTAQGTNALFDLISGNKDTLKFYYDYDKPRNIFQVIAKGVVEGAVSDIANMGRNAFNGWLNGKPSTLETPESSKIWNKNISKSQEDDNKNYGKMVVDGGTIYALDDWGEVVPEALMLGIKTDTTIHVTQQFPGYGVNGENKPNKVETTTLVWYDTTAIVNINSDKNVIATKVQGRDYTRKELVSNGDIKFSVSGQISSGLPDVYPTHEVEKFFKIMQHKGIVNVNCQVLNVLGVEQILITDFNLSSREGSKSVQSYSFSGLGLQPAKEIEITMDTVDIFVSTGTPVPEEEKNPWVSMLEDQAKGAMENIFNQGLNWSTGLLNGKL